MTNWMCWGSNQWGYLVKLVVGIGPIEQHASQIWMTIQTFRNEQVQKEY